MWVGSRAHLTPPQEPLCVVCAARATTKIVPSPGTRRDPTSGKVIHLTTMRLCEACRVRVMAGSITLGWSCQDERWESVGRKSAAGERYLRHVP